MTNKLRLAFLIDGNSALPLYHDVIKWALNSPEKFECVIISQNLNETPKTGSNAIFSRIVRNLKRISPYRILCKIESWKLAHAGEENFLDEICVSELCSKFVSVKPKQIGATHVFGKTDMEIIRSLKLDLCIRCGSGILRGDILDAFQFGIISIHHGDNRYYRGGPAGFWEVKEKNPSSGFIIQKLTSALDGGIILGRYNFCTKASWYANSAMLFAKSKSALKNKIHEIYRLREIKPAKEPGCVYLKPVYKKPRFKDILEYIYAVYFKRLKSIVVAKCFGKKRRKWSIVVSNAPFDKVQYSKLYYLTAPIGEFYADPFFIVREGIMHLYFEAFSLRHPKGIIKHCEFNGKEFGNVSTVLERSFHLSFPFIIEDLENIYMVPEQAESKQVVAYKCVDFPLKWEQEAVLVHGENVVDTMLFKQGDEYIMLSNRCSSGDKEYNSELYIHRNNDFLTCDWKLDNISPICAGPNGSRNGGFIDLPGGISRVGQVQGFLSYGDHVMIHELKNIKALSNYCHNDTRSFIIEKSEEWDGLHHVVSHSGYTVFDVGIDGRKLR